jgi:hypothetical protein
MLSMTTTTIIQGRRIDGDDIKLIRDLCRKHPEWSRYRLSRELATRWQWQNAKGQIKDMASRSLLRKLAARELIELPPPRCRSPNHYRHQPAAEVAHDSQPIQTSLRLLLPLRLLDTSKPATAKLFSHLLARYHYLGYRQTVGENLQYLIGAHDGRPLACVLFGSAAWKCAARDHFIGWDHEQRQRRLPMITNNQRFLILPWIQIKCLASHLLGFIARRISDDWQEKYGHPVVLLETFVDRQRFAGVCYRAANWQRVRKTTGRSRQDRRHRLAVPIKDVYVYPLTPTARERLCQ